MGEMVGLVGVGKMGSALLTRLLLAGHTVRAYDVFPAAMAAATESGAQAATSPADAVKGCRYAHLFPATDQQMEDVTTGPNGVFSTASPGTTIFLHSTILPTTTQRIAQAAPQGVTVLDAPVTSMPRLLKEGDGIFLVGGATEDVERVRPHLSKLVRTFYHFGPLGSGNKAKIARNLGNVVERVMMAETARLVEAAGLDISLWLAMVKDASGQRGAWSNWERALVVENNHAGPKRAAGLVTKDIHHAMALAKSCGTDLPVTQATAKVAGEWAAIWHNVHPEIKAS